MSGLRVGTFINYSSSLIFTRNSQKEGILTWDCQQKEHVLIFPTVFALLGDNPMQSEMACHIGLQGNAFCRACLVKRNGSATAPDANQPPDLDPDF
jgi:hypothetical protein